MKKLILIPTIILTVFLALAFVAPAAATDILRTVAPALQVGTTGVPAVSSAGTGTARVGTAAVAVSSSSQSSAAGSTSTSQRALGLGHTVSTTGHDNCGRFGDGFHGGKHDFVCPNRPFPAPAQPISH